MRSKGDTKVGIILVGLVKNYIQLNECGLALNPIKPLLILLASNSNMVNGQVQTTRFREQVTNSCANKMDSIVECTELLVVT